MTENYPTDAELNGLSGTTDAEQEVLYVATGESPYYTSFYKMLFRLLDMARRAGDLRVYKDGALTFGVRPGRYFNGDTAVNYAGATAQALTNNQTNYIYLTAAGVLTVNTTGFPLPSVTPHIPLATITTSAGEYSINDGDIVDYRGRAFLHARAHVVTDTTPSLGGDLDVNGHKITSIANTNVEIEPDGTGGVKLGSGATASGDYAVAEGASTAAGGYSHAEGAGANAAGDYSHAEGLEAKARLTGQHARASGQFAATGDCQEARYNLRGTTADANFTELTSPARFVLEDEHSYAVTLTIHGRQDTGANHAFYKRMVVIEQTGAAVALAGAVQTIGTDIETDANWDVQITADNVNKSLKVEVKGAAATNVRWNALLETVELGYAD